MICKECKCKVRWGWTNRGDQVPWELHGYNILHMCQEYLDALLDPKSKRKMPKHWLYVPKTVAEWRLGKHIKPYQPKIEEPLPWLT